MSHDTNEGHRINSLTTPAGGEVPEPASEAAPEQAPSEQAKVVSPEKTEGNKINSLTPPAGGEVPESASEAAPEQAPSEQAKVVSPDIIARNRANAQHSTGPKTPEGKEKSKQNSRKHGFFARQPLPAGEEGDKLWRAYGDLVAGIWEHYQPVDYMEGLLTEKIATESIRFSLLLTYESKSVCEQRAFHWDGVDRILRFQSAINRQLFQAMHELERLQDKRKGNANSSNRSDRAPGDKGNV